MARYKVRIAEMWESMNIIEQLVDNIPEGDYTAKMKAVLKLPAGEFFQRVETARGELAVYIVSDGNKITLPDEIPFSQFLQSIYNQ